MSEDENPLGWPKGSVRAILALFTVVAIVGSYVASIFTGFNFPAELLATATLILGYYFGAKVKE